MPIQDREEHDQPPIPDFTVIAGGLMGATVEAQGGPNDGGQAFLLIIDCKIGCTTDIGLIIPNRDAIVYCINAMRRHLERVGEPYDPEVEYDPDRFRDSRF